MLRGSGLKVNGGGGGQVEDGDKLWSPHQAAATGTRPQEASNVLSRRASIWHFYFILHWLVNLSSLTPPHTPAIIANSFNIHSTNNYLSSAYWVLGDGEAERTLTELPLKVYGVVGTSKTLPVFSQLPQNSAPAGPSRSSILPSMHLLMCSLRVVSCLSFLSCAKW